MTCSAVSKGWPEREAWFIFIFLDSLFKPQTWCCSPTNPLKHPKAARFINQITCVGCFVLSAFLLAFHVRLDSFYSTRTLTGDDRGTFTSLWLAIDIHWPWPIISWHPGESPVQRKSKQLFSRGCCWCLCQTAKNWAFAGFGSALQHFRTHLQDVFSSRNTFHICKAQSANQRGVWEPRNELSTSCRDMFFLVQDKVAAFCRFFEHAWNSEKHGLDR